MAKKKVQGPVEDRIEVHEDGTRHLVRGDSPFRLKAAEHRAHHRKMLVERHEAKMSRVNVKKARQFNNGWPSDKSPI